MKTAMQAKKGTCIGCRVPDEQFAAVLNKAREMSGASLNELLVEAVRGGLARAVRVLVRTKPPLLSPEEAVKQFEDEVFGTGKAQQ